MARWHAVTVRLSSGSPWAEGGYLSFCPEEVTKSSPSSKWIQAFSTAWLPPRRGVTDLPHHSRACAAWKSVLVWWHCIKNSIPRVPAVLLSACLKPLVQAWKTQCSQLHVNPVTIPPPALTSSGTFKCLWAKNSSLSPPGMCFWA